MRTARFYTGLVILAGPAMAILLAIPSPRAAPSGPVEGTVLSDRPSVGGMIFFTPGGPARRRGHQRQDRRGRAFRVRPPMAARSSGPDAVPDRHRADPAGLRIALTPDDTGEMPEVGDGVNPDRVGDGGRGPTRRIARASLRSQGRTSLRRMAESGRQRRSGQLRRTERVWLGPEPAHLDIDLRG